MTKLYCDTSNIKKIKSCLKKIQCKWSNNKSFYNEKRNVKNYKTALQEYSKSHKKIDLYLLKFLQTKIEK